MKIFGFSYVTGENFIRYLNEICGWSLLQEENGNALRDTEFVWDVYTDIPAAIRLGDMRVRLHPAANYMHALRNHVRRCHAEAAWMMMLPPDTFFGDGSISNLIASAYIDNACLAAPHVRVIDREFIAAIESRKAAGLRSLRNDELVSLAFETLHETWKSSFVDSNPSLTFHGGVLIKKLSEKIHVVQHLLPTYYLCKFIEEDLAYFDAANPRYWDWDFPSHAVAKGRHRVLCSSDLFFAAELTGAGRNLTPYVPPQTPADLFEASALHNVVNRFMMCTLRQA